MQLLKILWLSVAGLKVAMVVDLQEPIKILIHFSVLFGIVNQVSTSKQKPERSPGRLSAVKEGIGQPQDVVFSCCAAPKQPPPRSQHQGHSGAEPSRLQPNAILRYSSSPRERSTTGQEWGVIVLITYSQIFQEIGAAKRRAHLFGVLFRYYKC